MHSPWAFGNDCTVLLTSFAYTPYTHEHLGMSAYVVHMTPTVFCMSDYLEFELLQQ